MSAVGKKKVDPPSGSPKDQLEPTRQRILIAARKEFAAFGLAGARIDRIARDASASKERLYAYYRKKEELFSAVLELNLIEFARAVEPGDSGLPEFAGTLYDHQAQHSEHLRMIDWARLEGQGMVAPSIEIVEAFHLSQTRRIEAMQRAGQVDPAWHPEHLSALIFGIVTCWLHEPSSALAPHATPSAGAIADRRASVVRAVQRLIEPRT